MMLYHFLSYRAALPTLCTFSAMLGAMLWHGNYWPAIGAGIVAVIAWYYEPA